MPANCRILKKPDDLDSVAQTLQKSEAITSFIRRFPHIGAVIRLINPAADMVDENVARHVIGHQVLREGRQTSAEAALSLVARGKTLPELFDIKDGIVSLKTRAGKDTTLHVNDLLEGRRTLQKYQLSPEQKSALKLRKDIWDDARFDYNRFVGKGGRLNTEDAMFPRAVDGFVDPKTGKLVRTDDVGNPVKSRYGGSPLSKGGSFTNARAADAAGNVKSSTQMVADGWKYKDPDAVLHAKVLEITRRTADAQFADWLTRQPNVLKKGQILGKGAKTGVNPAKFGMVGFDAAQTPALAGYYAPPEVVKYVNEMMSVEKKAVIPLVTTLVNESRGAIASADFGTTGVQLLGALGADMGHLIGTVASLGTRSRPSNIFGTAVYNSFKSFFSEGNLARYYADNKPVIDRWNTQLGSLKNSEYVSALLNEGNKSLVMHLPLMTRFGRAFEASLDVAKIEYAKSLERILGEDIPAADKEALGGWIRNSTGMTSTARLGISPRQQDIEATWLFFSPRFTRSLFAMTGTLLKADKAGHESRLALGGLAAGATGMYIAAAAALGQEPDLNPIKNGRANPGFFSLRIGDNRIGVGGGMRALTRLAAESYESARYDPTRFISPDFKGTHANPFLAFWRSRSAPLTGTIMDIWTGADFRGQPIEDGNDWGRVLMSRTLPFGLQAALEARGQSMTKAGIALASGFGLNTNPMTAFQLYDAALKDIHNADGSPRFPDGAATTKADLQPFVDANPDIKALRDQYEQSRLTGSSPGRDIQVVLNDRKTKLDAADALLAQTGDYRRYRQQVNEIRANSRTQMEDLHLGSVTNSGDRAIVSSWYDTYKNPAAVDPVTGGINSDGLDQIQSQWNIDHPGEYDRLIKPAELLGETPMETKLREDRATIAASGWWDSDQNAWDTVKQLIASRALDGKLQISQYKTYADFQLGQRARYVQQFRDAGRPQPELLADIAMSKNKLVSAFNKVRMRDRLILQKNNPGLTALLNQWGYNHTSLQEYRLAVRQGQQDSLAAAGG